MCHNSHISKCDMSRQQPRGTELSASHAPKTDHPKKVHAESLK